MKKWTVCAMGMALAALPAYADHQWGSYHWARSTSSFDLIIIDSTTPEWDAYVTQARADWSASIRLNMVEKAGDTSTTTRQRCSASSGYVRVCNLAYGSTGWLGLASIAIDSKGHIVAGYTKLNDTYFSKSTYNTQNWRQMVTCQEIGHDIGLAHQDENFGNTSLYSCMDYQNPPYPYPNSHDYEQLEIMYGHLDNYDTYAGAAPNSGDGGSTDGGDGGGGGGGGGRGNDKGCNSPPGKGCNKGSTGVVLPGDIGWGISIGRRGNQEEFLRIAPDGTRILTHVTWAEEHFADDHDHTEDHH
jgi:hypothetical protein